jgi:hypothetical protein
VARQDCYLRPKARLHPRDDPDWSWLTAAALTFAFPNEGPQ